MASITTFDSRTVRTPQPIAYPDVSWEDMAARLRGAAATLAEPGLVLLRPALHLSLALVPVSLLSWMFVAF